MSKIKRVLISGSIAYDEIMDFPGEFIDYFHPEKLHQINVSFVVNRLEKQLGGTATNIAYNLSRALNFLNNNTFIKIVSTVGKDGKDFLRFFKKNKIDTNNITQYDNLFTATGKVITDKKDNQIWGFYYGANEKVFDLNFKKIDKNESLTILSATHKNPFLKVQSQIIAHKLPYFYDPGMTLTWITDKDLLKGVLNAKYLIGNDYEIAMVTKRIKKTISELTGYGLQIITTLGEQGILYEEKNKKIEVKGYKVNKMVDPTGAGDAWRGGFVAGLISNLELQDCLKLGNVLASFSIESYGTVNHNPKKNEIGKRLKSL
ncbi:MAG: PfkB family carbohydrate kinase [bacterium]